MTYNCKQVINIIKVVPLMMKKIKHNIKIVYLKEKPRNQLLYEIDQLRNQTDSRQNILQNLKKQSNKTSIAYLSSILQDSVGDQQESIINKQSTEQAFSLDFEKETQKYQPQKQFRISKAKQTKSNERNLSCLLEINTGKLRSHTLDAQNINKLIHQRKVMPIDRLRYKKKDISFSCKNKLDLNKDFNYFVEKNKSQSNQSHDFESRKTAVYMARRQFAIKRNIKTEPIQLYQKDSIPDLFRPQNQMKQKGSLKNCGSVSFYTQLQSNCRVDAKSFASGMPVLKKFKWSKLSIKPYKISK